MLTQRVLSTLTLFSILELPLTLLELHRYLLPENRAMLDMLDSQWEIADQSVFKSAPVALDELLVCLETQCSGKVECKNGFYFPVGQSHLADGRLRSYSFGFPREKLIRRYCGFLRFVPFVRGAALSGSQALGMQKATSDIDLFIVTDERFLWLARTLVTGYFQMLGLRRHGNHIANRFCLNHYLSRPKMLDRYRNVYTAFEYLKLRPLVLNAGIFAFQCANERWLLALFPNARLRVSAGDPQPRLQRVLERALSGRFGIWLEQRLKRVQLPKIRSKEKFIVASDDELSFHPDSKQQGVLKKFFSGEQSVLAEDRPVTAPRFL